MREILFRGQRADNGEWVEGYFVALNSKCYIGKEVTENTKSVSCLNGTWYGFDNFYEVAPETVGQHTGLTDKYGKKIFEGDIVRYVTNTNRADNKDIHEVVLETRGASCYFGIKMSQIETWAFCLEVPAKLMEVIGNIHDNPELLKGGAEE